MPRQEDDFVLTISDNDEDGDLDLADELESDEETTTQTKNLKRKRDDEPATNGKGKKSKTSADHVPEIKAAKSKKAAAKAQAQAKHLDSEDDEEENGKDDGMLNPNFAFEFGNELGPVVADEEFDGWALASSKEEGKRGVDIDDLVRRRRGETTAKAVDVKDEDEDEDEDEEDEFGLSDEDEDEDGFGMAVDLEPESEEDGEPHANEDEDEDEADSIASPVPHPDDLDAGSNSDSDSQVDAEEQAKQDAFFDSSSITVNGQSTSASTSSFNGMSLSRPILKGLSSLNFSTPTPIQSQTIPLALLGRDIVGGAVTGSGKTGAFTIPILERLLYRPRKIPVSRVVILMPTRELAVQCFNVARKLASFTDISFALVVGGFSLREQELTLKSRPDVIVATPGRFIDHMRNSASFSVEGIEILVLDEADRMLEDGFADELNEILSTLPKRRQTMLFSATMTSSVDRLISLGMSKPVRVLVDSTRSTVSTLTQEFVRLRPGRENRRLAALMVLCSQYSSRCIIFFRQKREAHRVRIVFALCGLSAAELHGSMTQEQRIASVENFRVGKANFLLATDVASRGLDIRGVETVINYEAPQTHEIYLHRVGRTARAGRSGTAVTIAAEQDRKVVKAAVKSGKSQGAKIASKVLDIKDVDSWFAKLENMESEIEEVLSEEKEEKAMQVTEMNLRKGENMIRHEDEIMSRPKRTWFESEKEKKESKERGARELNGEVGGGKKGKKRRDMSGKERKREDAKMERKDEGRMWKKGRKEREAPQQQRGGKGKQGQGGKGKLNGKPGGKGRK